jgi:phosphatidylinositol phospholipase C beta
MPSKNLELPSFQILSGQFLTDRHVGTYVEVDMFGLPCDTVRRKFKTQVVPGNGICPQFSEEPFLFRQVSFSWTIENKHSVQQVLGRLRCLAMLPYVHGFPLQNKN